MYCYNVVDDILYHRRKAKSKRTQSLASFQLVIPKVMIPQILKIAHDSPLGGHSGIQNTLDYVREHYYFACMGKIVSDYVQSCQDCQSRKVSTCKTKAKITPYATPTEPFEVWQMDMFGPLIPSNNGNRYVFTAVTFCFHCHCAILTLYLCLKQYLLCFRIMVFVKP